MGQAQGKPITVSQLRFFITLIITCFLLACTSRPEPAPVQEVYRGKSIFDVEKAAYQKDSYQVQEGDTLYSIAWFSGKDFRVLASLNQIAAPYAIYPGQTLRLATQAKPLSKAKHTGRTRKTIDKTPVDPPKKQAYGGTKVVDNSDKKTAIQGTRGNAVKQWIWPARGKVINRFSASGSGNKGIDIAGNFDASIVAAADGKVVYVGNALRGYGNLIIVKHSETYLSAYAHTNRILVKERQIVKAGDKIATMGNSGSEGNHLHFEIRHKGKSRDPLQFLPAQ